MDCGQSDFVCVGLYWFSSSLDSIVKAVLAYAEALRPMFASPAAFTSGLLGLYYSAIALIKQHGNALGTLASVSFAIWKAYHSRKSYLYRKLGIIITEEARRLSAARVDVADMIMRPAAGGWTKLPMFALPGVRKILSTRRWRPLVRATAFPKRTNSRINAAIENAELLEKAHAGRLTNAREQRVAGYILKGVILAARADAASDNGKRDELNADARKLFQQALTVPEFATDAQAIELDAMQLLRLRQFSAAAAGFQRLEASAEGHETDKAKALLFARARTGQAHAAYAQGEPRNANIHLNAAVAALQAHLPYTSRDCLEHGSMHELHARARRDLGFGNVALASEADAMQCYRAAITQLHRKWYRRLTLTLWGTITHLWSPSHLLWRNGRAEDAIAAAKQGLQRLQASPLQGALAPVSAATSAVSA
jgi:hypothetical protein